MRYTFDFEFVEGNPCHPISLGIAEVDGYRRFYAEWPNAEELANSNQWLGTNVLPYLDADCRFNSAEEIATAIKEFLGEGEYELYASYGAYDFFLLSQALGGFQGCPKNFPYTYRDTAHMDLPRVEVCGVDHNALMDALTIRRAILTKEGKCR